MPRTAQRHATREAWIAETLHSHVLFDAALQNVSKKFGPEQTERRVFNDAAGLSRERLALNSSEVRADRAYHHSAEPREYPIARSVMKEIVYGFDTPAAAQTGANGAAGLPVSRQWLCPTSTAESDGTYIGPEAPVRSAWPKHVPQRSSGKANWDLTTSVQDRMVFFGSELDEHQDLPTTPRSSKPQDPDTNLNHSLWENMVSGGEGQSSEVGGPRSGVRVLSCQTTPRKATGRAAGSFNPMESPRSATVSSSKGQPHERWQCAAGENKGYTSSPPASGRVSTRDAWQCAAGENRGYARSPPVSSRKHTTNDGWQLAAGENKGYAAAVSYGYGDGFAGLNSTSVNQAEAAVIQTKTNSRLHYRGDGLCGSACAKVQVSAGTDGRAGAGPRVPEEQRLCGLRRGKPALKKTTYHLLSHHRVDGEPDCEATPYGRVHVAPGHPGVR